MFKIEMLIFQPTANLDEKVLFDKITHMQEPNIRKMPVRSLSVRCKEFVNQKK